MGVKLQALEDALRLRQMLGIFGGWLAGGCLRNPTLPRRKGATRYWEKANARREAGRALVLKELFVSVGDVVVGDGDRLDPRRRPSSAVR